MRQVGTLLLAVFLVIALIIGGIAGYLVANQSKSPVSQAAFLNYTDSYGGPIDESRGGYVSTALLVAGFSRGQIAWYWLIGPSNNTVSPVYFFQYANGQTVHGQYPIIDAKPGDRGYTHFWEIYNVTVPDTYTPNTIKSVSTLQRAQQSGLATITDSKRAMNGPLVAKNVKITVVNGEPEFLPVWYRTRTSMMALFETNLPGGNVPSISIWLIQKASDACPLLEALCNKDLNHDSDIKDSNDLIGTTPGQTGYFPLWAVSILHVHDSYLPAGFPSPFPQDPATLKANYGMFTSLEDAQADRGLGAPVYVDLSTGDRGLTFTGNLVNCPALPLGIQPPAISIG